MSMLGTLLPMLLSSVAAYHGLSSTYALWQRRFAAQPDVLDGAVPAPADFRPSVDVIVTCLNEDLGLLEKCLRSVENQDYPPALMRVFVVDDGSCNVAALESVYGRYAALPGWTVVRAPRNRGKRQAQSIAYDLGFNELVLMVDSDTVIEPDGISKLVARFADARVGSVCSNIMVLNERRNWLTRSQTRRYDLLFNYERAAQSRFGAVLCCAGPFAMFRRSALETEVDMPVSLWGRRCSERATVWQHYLRQHPMFMRKVKFVSGDDLHLTHLVLLAGYRSEYEPAAVALTEVPSGLGHFRRQQQRWNRSLYRELPWTVMVLRRSHPYLWLDVAGRALLPLLLVAVLALTAVCALAGGALRSAAAVAAASLLVGHWLTLPREHRVTGFFLRYGVVYVLFLLPAKLYALVTPLAGSWGTRGPQVRRRPAAALR